MQDILLNLSTYGYIILFLYSLGGGMVAIIAAGILSYQGSMNIELSIAIAAISNFLGDSLLFYMSRYNKDAMMPYLRKHRRKLALSHVLMKKYGDKIIVIKKYIYGLKTLVPIAVGLTRYSSAKFAIINGFGAIIWAVSLGLVSYFAGEFMENGVIYVKDNPWIMPIFVFTLVGGLWCYFKVITKKTLKK